MTAPPATFSAPPTEAHVDPTALSIGGLSRATDVAVETLRTWERRYGFPEPLPRAASEHGRYPLQAAERIRLVVRALDHGHPASVVLRAGEQGLRRLIGLHGSMTVGLDAGLAVRAGSELVDGWLAYVGSFDARGLAHGLAQAWNAYGSANALTELVALPRGVGHPLGSGRATGGARAFRQ